MPSKITAALLLTVATIVIAPCALASEHFFVFGAAGPAHSNVEFIDAGSLSRSNDGVTVWSVNVYKSVQELGGGMNYKYALNRAFFDCKNQSITDLETIAYQEGGVPVGTSTYPTGPYRVVPDTVGDRMLDKICSNTLPSRGYSSVSEAVSAASRMMEPIN